MHISVSYMSSSILMDFDENETIDEESKMIFFRGFGTVSIRSGLIVQSSILLAQSQNFNGVIFGAVGFCA